MLFEDRFVDNQNEWPILKDENIVSSITNNKFNVKLLTQNRSTWFQPSRTVSDMDLTVETTFVEGNSQNIGYGVLCHIIDSKNFYGITITPNSQYMIYKNVNDTAQMIVDLPQSDAIKKGSGVTNTMRVICANNKITLLINDVALADVTDDTFTGGTFALQAGSQDVDKKPLEVAFSNFVMRKPTQSAATSSEKVLSDKFDDNQNQWELYDESGVSVTIEKGQLVMRILKMELFWTKPSLNLVDFDLSFDATVQEGAAGSAGYGVICRYQDEGNYYVFLIIDNGQYGLLKSVNGKFEDVVAIQKSNVIKSGKATNKVRVVCSGENLQLDVNDQSLIQVKDNTFTKGDFRLVGQSFDKNGKAVKIAFDNLVVFKR